MRWTNGQPFLSQKICQLIRNSDDSIPINGESAWIANLVQTKIISNWSAQDEPEHLRTIRDRLLSLSNRVSVLEQYRLILERGKVPQRTLSNTLELLLSGLVIKQAEMLVVANLIYASIFDRDWLERTGQSLRINRLVVQIIIVLRNQLPFLAELQSKSE